MRRSPPPVACASQRTGEAGQAGGGGLPALLAVQRREADQRADAAQAGVGNPEAAAQLQLLQAAQAAEPRQLLACAVEYCPASAMSQAQAPAVLKHRSLPPGLSDGVAAQRVTCDAPGGDRHPPQRCSAERATLIDIHGGRGAASFRGAPVTCSQPRRSTEHRPGRRSSSAATALVTAPQPRRERCVSRVRLPAAASMPPSLRRMQFISDSERRSASRETCSSPVTSYSGARRESVRYSNRLLGQVKEGLKGYRDCQNANRPTPPGHEVVSFTYPQLQRIMASADRR